MGMVCILFLLLWRWTVCEAGIEFNRHPKTVIATAVPGHVLAYADLDMNRYVDLIVSTAPNSLSVYIADPDGFNFTLADWFSVTLPSEYRIANVAVGDFDGDVFPDLLISSKNAKDERSFVTVCWGSPERFSCDFNSPWLLEDQPLIADCNLDQIGDFIAIADRGRSRNCYTGSPTREFKPLSYFQSTKPLKTPFFSATVDLNADLIPEVVLPVKLEIGDAAVARWEVWSLDLKSANWTLLPEHVLPPLLPANMSLFRSEMDGYIVGAPVFEDFNADGEIDLLVPVCSKTQVCNKLQLYLLIKKQWYCQILNLTHSLNGTDWHVAKVPSDRQITIRAGDFNSDGYPDLLAVLETGGGSRAVFVFENRIADQDSLLPLPSVFAVVWEPVYRGRAVEDAAFFDLMETGTLDILILERRKDGTPLSTFVSSIFEYESTFIKVQVNSPRCNDSCMESGRGPAVLWPGSTVSVQFKTSDGGQLKGAQSLLYSCTYRSLLLPYQLFGLGPSLSFIESMSIGIATWSHSTMSWLHVIPNARLYVIPSPPDSPNDWTRRLYVTPGRVLRESLIAFATVFAVIASIVLLLQWRESSQDREERRQMSRQFYFGSIQ